jgi:hypothetical protein
MLRPGNNDYSHTNLLVFIHIREGYWVFGLTFYLFTVGFILQGTHYNYHVVAFVSQPFEAEARLNSI